MAHALWKGAISFGFIYVPVELHTASKDSTLPLHMVDSRDFAHVGYQRICKNTGKEADWAHIMKGYEYRKGEFVALADADFKHANVKASETIEIDTFCDERQIAPMYLEKLFYLPPIKGGEKVYSPFCEALEATNKVAVATFVMHQRQHLCAIAPQGKSLAKQRVQSMEGSYVAGKFKDTYRADLKRHVQEKLATKRRIHWMSRNQQATRGQKRRSASLNRRVGRRRASAPDRV